MKRVRVAVTSAGAGPGIAVIKALKKQKEIPLEVIAMDMDPTGAGLYLADKHCIVPAAKSEGFIEFILSYCRSEEINFILPIFDLETPVFSRSKRRFREEAGINILISDFETIDTSNDKVKSQILCESNGILCPAMFTVEEMQTGKVSFPVILKPKEGIGSKGVKIINNLEELERQLPLDESFLIQEYIEGVEYSIDSISDAHGKFLACVPRERMVVKAGQTVKGKTTKDNELERWGKTVAETFGIQGPGCSQCKVRDGEIYFMEMNPRYGTGVSLAIGAGLNIPLLQIKMALGIEIRAEELQYKDDFFMTRYWEEVFLDGSKLNKVANPDI